MRPSLTTRRASNEQACSSGKRGTHLRRNARCASAEPFTWIWGLWCKGRNLGFKSRERSIKDMDQQQQQQVNEAAEKFADAVRDSYRVVSDRAVSAQQLNAELTQNFFNSV